MRNFLNEQMHLWEWDLKGKKAILKEKKEKKRRTESIYVNGDRETPADAYSLSHRFINVRREIAKINEYKWINKSEGVINNLKAEIFLGKNHSN